MFDTHGSYRTYSLISRSAYKPTPKVLFRAKSKMLDPRISHITILLKFSNKSLKTSIFCKCFFISEDFADYGAYLKFNNIF